MKTLCIILSATLFLSSCSKKNVDVEPSNKPSMEESPSANTNDKVELDPPLIAKDPATKNNSPEVIMDTNFGEIVIKLDALNAPVTVENFLNYVKSKHYDNTQFHRVIKGFMIQGGGFSSEGDEKETVAPIKNEGKNGLTNKRGSIAMARTNDPNSATSQFFINTVDNSRTLDAGGANGPDGYAVFGEVISGMETVDKIATVRVGPKTLRSRAPNGQLYPSPNGDVPVENVFIKTLRLKSED